MQVVGAKVDDPIALRILDVRIADIPFSRHDPVEDLGARCHLVDVERNLFADNAQRLPDTIAGDAAAQRKQSTDELVHGHSRVIPIGEPQHRKSG